MQDNCFKRSLTCPAALSNLWFSLASAIIIGGLYIILFAPYSDLKRVYLHRAFTGQWNWLLIQGFDPLYTKELAGDEETTGFLANVYVMTGELAAIGDYIHVQLKNTLDLAM